MNKVISAITAITMGALVIAPSTISGISNKPVSTAFVQSIDTNAAGYSTGKYQINTASGCNVRSGAGTNYSKLGAACNGTQFTVTKVSGSWGYGTIKCTNGTKTGWVCLTYTKYLGSGSTGTTTTVTSRSFQNAYNYAKKYWNTRNYSYNYYSGKNCANFVSQCLVAGGVKTSSTWKNGTYAFVNCTGLRNYFTSNYGVKYVSSPKASSINPGDVIYTNGGGHVMFVMKKSGSTIYASGNTNNRDCLALSTSSICGVLQTSKLF